MIDLNIYEIVFVVVLVIIAVVIAYAMFTSHSKEDAMAKTPIKRVRQPKAQPTGRQAEVVKTGRGKATLVTPKTTTTTTRRTTR